MLFQKSQACDETWMGEYRRVTRRGWETPRFDENSHLVESAMTTFMASGIKNYYKCELS